MSDPVAPEIADFARYRVGPGEDVDLDRHDTADTGGYAGQQEAEAELSGLVRRIADLQARLYAEEKRSVLVVLQGIDAAGKDSTVKHVFRGSNPQGVRVYSFKQPTEEEATHDFLSRYHGDTPADGMMHVFNRSHYEDVMVVRVHDLAPGEVVAFDHKWFRRLVVARVVAGTRDALDPRWAEQDPEVEAYALEELESSASKR